jgi:hypothetical protein
MLNKGQVALVDDWNFDRLNKYRWRAKWDGKTYYAYRSQYTHGKKHMVSMHREILNTPKGVQVNHLDWNGLNNQEYNIKNCTASENCQYVRPRSNTGYLGVSRHKSCSTNGTIHIYYTADIQRNHEIFRLYHGKDVLIAAKAYDTKAQELFGEFANLNFK